MKTYQGKPRLYFIFRGLVFKFTIDEFEYVKTVNLLSIILFTLHAFTPELMQVQDKFIAKVQALSGKQLSGQIIRITNYCLSLKNNKVTDHIDVACSDIKSLRISKKGAMG